MQTIKRDIYVTKNVLQAPIEVTEGTNSIAIEFDVRDYDIPASAAAVAYSLSTSSMEEPNKALADVSGNKITIIPSEAFFLPGQNVMQIRIIDGNSKLISFNIIVKCTGKMRFGDEKEEQQSTLVEQMLAKLGEYQKKSASPYNFKGSCLSSALPASGNTINDTYYCTDLKYRKTWNGSAWEQSSLNEADYEDELTKTNGEVSSLKEDMSKLPNNINDFELQRISPTIKNGYFLNDAGIEKPYTTCNILSFNVTPNSTIHFGCHYGQALCLYAFYNNSELVSIKSLTYDDIGYYEGKIKVPYNANTIRLNSMYIGGIAKNDTCYVFEEGNYKAIKDYSLEEYAPFINQLIKNQNVSTKALSPINVDKTGYSIKHTDLSYGLKRLITFTDQNYYNKSYNIQEDKLYCIEAYSFYDARPYYFVTDDNIILDYKEETSKEQVLTRFIVKSPKRATKLFINGITGLDDISVSEVIDYKIVDVKKWGIIGDSLSERVGVTAHNYTSKFYYEFVQDKINIDVNCVAKRGKGFKNGFESNYDFTSQINKLDNNCEIVTVFGSGNDLSYKTSSGDYGKISDTFTTFSDSSVCACMKHFIETWLETYPTKHLVIFSPTMWSDNDHAHGGSTDMETYVNMQKSVCEYYKIPFIDLFHDSGIIPSNAVFKNEYTVDGTHLNIKGHKWIASLFYNEIVKRIW